MNPVRIEIKRLRLNTPDELPKYHSAGASGMDLRANIAEPIEIPSGGVAAVPCGIAIAVPVGYEAQVRPRSGLALRNQVTVLNTPGTVDSDYRGEIVVILANFGASTFLVDPGARIAQLVIAPVATVIWTVTDRACFSTLGPLAGFRPVSWSDCVFRLRPTGGVEDFPSLLLSLRIVTGLPAVAQMIERGVGATYITEDELAMIQVPTQLNAVYPELTVKYARRVKARNVAGMRMCEAQIRSDLIQPVGPLE